jgi:hypothetical protein
MGLITIKEPYMGMVCLGSPNYSIQTIYWEYMMQLVQDHSPEMTVRRDGGVAYHPSEIFIADDVATCSECGAIIAEVTPLSINDAYYCPDCYCKKIKKINDSYEKHYDQSRKANETIVMCQCCLRWLCDDEIDHYAFGNVCPECLEEFFDEEKIKNFRL